MIEALIGDPGLILMLGLILFLLATVSATARPSLRLPKLPKLPRTRARHQNAAIPRARLREDPSTTSAYVGLLSLMRRRDPAALNRLDAQLNQARASGGLGVVAQAAFSALNGGDEAEIRGLMQLANELPREFIHPHARRVARDWLVASAAERGDWASVVRLGRMRPLVLWSYCVARAAERLTLDPRAPSRKTLRVLFVLAGRWKGTWPFIRRALDVEMSLVPPSANPPAPDWTEAIQRLLSVLSDRSRRAELYPALSSALSALAVAPSQESIEAHLAERLPHVLSASTKSSLSIHPEAAPHVYLTHVLARLRREALASLVSASAEVGSRARIPRPRRVAREEWLRWAKFRQEADAFASIDRGHHDELFAAVGPALSVFAERESRQAFAWSVCFWLRQNGTLWAAPASNRQRKRPRKAPRPARSAPPHPLSGGPLHPEGRDASLDEEVSSVVRLPIRVPMISSARTKPSGAEDQDLPSMPLEEKVKRRPPISLLDVSIPVLLGVVFVQRSIGVLLVVMALILYRQLVWRALEVGRDELHLIAPWRKKVLPLLDVRHIQTYLDAEGYGTRRAGLVLTVENEPWPVVLELGRNTPVVTQHLCRRTGLRVRHTECTWWPEL